MAEKFRENPEKRTRENTREVENFDTEAEKRYRQEIKKRLSGELSSALRDYGFEKTGYSLWSKKVGNSWYILYLQRSQFSHEYYVELGICEKKDIPRGEKLDIVFCKKRARIETIVENIEKERTQKEENAEEIIGKKLDYINASLNFEAIGARKKYPKEYFVPSVNPKEAENKIDKIQKAVREYVPLWFNINI